MRNFTVVIKATTAKSVEVEVEVEIEARDEAEVLTLFPGTDILDIDDVTGFRRKVA